LLSQIKAGRTEGEQSASDATLEPAMSRLMMILFSMIATTLMGIGIIIALVTGHDTLQPIVVAAGIGFVLALPVAWYVAKQIES
jgi:uncharacterized protein with PQ loop repeat